MYRHSANKETGGVRRLWSDRVGLGVLSLLGPCLLGGCVGDDGAGGAAQRDRGDRGEVVFRNPFAAGELRIHPLTRVLADQTAGARSIEAHIELLDGYGHPVKALGQFNFTLYRGASRGSGADQLEQLKRWSVDLSDPGENSAVYDIVTRTYQVILTDVPGAVGTERGFELVVRFTSPDDMTVSSTHRF